MGKNENFTTTVSDVIETNEAVGAGTVGTIYRDEVFKDIVRYKFTAAILIKYILNDYKNMHPIEIARLIRDTREHNILSNEDLLQDEIDTLNIVIGTGAEKNIENDFIFEIYKDENRQAINIVTINFEMQNKFSTSNPNTISRAVYYGGSLLRSTVPAGDTFYSNLHKVYTIWICNARVHFADWNADKICREFGKEYFLYKHRYNIRRNYDELPDKVIPPEPESDLIELDFVEIPILRKKVKANKAERYEEILLQFMENVVESLPILEKEYGIDLLKYKKGVNETMSIAERYEIKIKKMTEEADKKVEEANKEKVRSIVRMCFKCKVSKEQAFDTIYEDNTDISTELLKDTIEDVYGESLNPPTPIKLLDIE